MARSSEGREVVMRPAAWISTIATLIGLERYSNRFFGYNSTECVLTSDDIMSIMLYVTSL